MANWEFVVKMMACQAAEMKLLQVLARNRQCAVKKYSTGSPPPDKVLWGNSTL